MRNVVGRLCAVLVFALTVGRVRGRNFILVPPFHLRASSGSRIHLGARTLIGPQARIVANGADLVIGADVFIGKNVTLVAYAPLEVGDGALIAENVSVHTENHGPAGAREDFSCAPIRIGHEVWLGAGVVVLPGAHVGDEATVGANAVVRGALDSEGTYVGVPARRVR